MAALVAAAFATGCGGQRRASGTIVFQGRYHDGSALYAVRPDGTGLTRLPVRLPQDGAEVYWTRDGTRALVSYDNGNGGAAQLVFDARSLTLRPVRLAGRVLTGSSEAGYLSTMPWSPDGSRLVLPAKREDVVLDLKTGAHWNLKDGPNDELVTWSADGKDLLFPAGHDIYAAPARGGAPRRLLRLSRLEPVGLQASADGKWISFEVIDAKDHLYVVRPNGSGLRLIASAESMSYAWSPRGERLAFADSKGIVLADLANGHRRRLVAEHLDDPMDESPAWSPDGNRILYSRPDLADAAHHGLRLWAMTADGAKRHPVTHGVSGDEPQWIEASVSGTPPPRQHLVSFSRASTLITDLPIVSLGAEGNRAAVAQGFGGSVGYPGPLGPLVVWDRSAGTRAGIPVHGCASVDDVLVVAQRLAYRCENAYVSYGGRDALRVGKAVLARTDGGEFTGTFLEGIAADRDTIVWDVEDAGSRSRGEFRIHRTRVWTAAGRRKRLVRTFAGQATVAALEAGRIAVLRGGSHVIVGTRSFTFGGPRILGAALDGVRLVVLQAPRVTVLDLRSGRRTAWPARRGFGPDPELEDARGGLVVYAVGAALHVLRLADGHEVVLDTPNATDPVFARFVPDGLFYSYNESYAKHPGRLVFVSRAELGHALAR